MSQIIKRFVVFAMDEYEPSGGWSDFRFSSDDAGEAMANANAQNAYCWQVVDLFTGIVTIGETDDARNKRAKRNRLAEMDERHRIERDRLMESDE